MSKNKERNPEGTVIAMPGNGFYKVEMDTGEELLCYLAGKMKVRHINVNIGDRVEVIVDPAGGKTTNRIVWRK